MHKQRIYIIIAAAVGILTIFLPWATNVPGANNVTGAEAGEWLAPVLFAIAIVFTFLGDRTKPLSDGLPLYGVAGAGVLAAIVCIFKLIAIPDAFMIGAKGAPEAREISDGVHAGFGLYLAIIAAIAVAALAFLMKSTGISENIKKPIHEPKNPHVNPAEDKTLL